MQPEPIPSIVPAIPATAPEPPEAVPAPRGRWRRLARPVIGTLVIAGLAAGAAFGWKSSVDRGTTLRRERTQADDRISALTRDKTGLESQVSALRSSLATCKQAVEEVAGVALVLADYPELVGQAAAAVLDYDFVGMGRIVGVMEQLERRLDAALAASTGAVGDCLNTSAA